MQLLYNTIIIQYNGKKTSPFNQNVIVSFGDLKIVDLPLFYTHEPISKLVNLRRIEIMKNASLFLLQVVGL